MLLANSIIIVHLNSPLGSAETRIVLAGSIDFSATISNSFGSIIYLARVSSLVVLQGNPARFVGASWRRAESKLSPEVRLQIDLFEALAYGEA